jgi:hypothetical protein
MAERKIVARAPPKIIVMVRLVRTTYRGTLDKTAPTLRSGSQTKTPAHRVGRNCVSSQVAGSLSPFTSPCALNHCTWSSTSFTSRAPPAS